MSSITDISEKVKEANATLIAALEDTRTFLKTKELEARKSARSQGAATGNGALITAGFLGKAEAYNDISQILDESSPIVATITKWVNVACTIGVEIDQHVQRYEGRGDAQVAALQSIAESLQTLVSSHTGQGKSVFPLNKGEYKKGTCPRCGMHVDPGVMCKNCGWKDTL